MCVGVTNDHFQKITGALKIYIFFWKFAETFIIHQRTISKINFGTIFVYYYFLFTKTGKTVFDFYKVKINIFLNFSSFLALKNQRIRSPRTQVWKKLNNFWWVHILGRQSKFSEALRPGLGTAFFSFGTFRSFPFFKKNVPFFFRVFGDLWDPKERSALF